MKSKKSSTAANSSEEATASRTRFRFMLFLYSSFNEPRTCSDFCFHCRQSSTKSRNLEDFFQKYWQRKEEKSGVETISSSRLMNFPKSLAVIRWRKVFYPNHYFTFCGWNALISDVKTCRDWRLVWYYSWNPSQESHKSWSRPSFYLFVRCDFNGHHSLIYPARSLVISVHVNIIIWKPSYDSENIINHTSFVN